MGVGDFCKSLDVDDIGIGIAQSFHINRLGFVGYGRLKSAFFFGVDKGGGYPRGQGQGMCKEVIGSAVDGLGGYDMLPAFGKSLNGVVYGGGTRRGCKGGRATFKRGNAAFENILGRVGQSAVNVAGVPETEAVGSVLRIVENKRSGRINLSLIHI